MNRCWSLALLAPLLAGCVAAPAPRHADTVETRADTGDTDAAGDTEDTDIADVPDDTEDTSAPDDGLVGVRPGGCVAAGCTVAPRSVGSRGAAVMGTVGGGV
jgi:hypothetical protein